MKATHSEIHYDICHENGTASIAYTVLKRIKNTFIFIIIIINSSSFITQQALAADNKIHIKEHKIMYNKALKICCFQEPDRP